MKGPSEQSTREPVRCIRSVPGLESKSASLYQDPRFDTALGKADLHKTRKNYRFLDTYRESEIGNLKKSLKHARSEHDRETISKAIQAQKSRLETLRNRDAENEIMQKLKHQKITRAKKREILLKEKFSKMSSRDVNKSVEKRRRKIAQKQKKMLPERRSTE